MQHELFKIESIDKVDNGFVVHIRRSFNPLIMDFQRHHLIFKDRSEFKQWLESEVY